MVLRGVGRWQPGAQSRDQRLAPRLKTPYVSRCSSLMLAGRLAEPVTLSDHTHPVRCAADMLRRMPLRASRRLPWWLLLVVSLLLAACSSGPGTSQKQSITLYTCVNDTTIQPILQKFQAAHPGQEVKLFRAPTGELNARVASDVRSGGLKADVIWACDPLTMQDYVTQGLVGGWTPQTDIPETMRTPDYC